MKSALILASVLVAMAAPSAVEESRFSLTVTASGLTWKVNWTKAVIDSLKRLSGVKEVSQDDFQGGVATFLVTFDAPPTHTIAAIKKQVGKYKVDKIAIKLTGKAADKSGTWYLGAVALKGEMTAQVAELKGKVITITGVLSEDEKGKQTCELSKVEEAKTTK